MRLDELEALLRDGIRLSGQTSLGRRMPERASLPVLATARDGLRDFVAENPSDVRGWRLVSLAEETMLSYPRAVTALRRVLELSGKSDHGDLKRLAAIQEAAREWDELGLTAVQLAQLGAFLDGRAADLGHGFTHTRHWLDRVGLSAPEAERVLEVLRGRGARCDEDVFQIARGTWV